MSITATPDIQTTSGHLRGAIDGGVHVFRGIPYATARRFRPPRRVEAWRGVRDALRFGPAAPHMTGGRRPPALEAALGRPASLDDGQSEDCLVLNVWTPGLNDGARRPVTVWIHGGGYYAGSGAAPHTHGEALAQRGDVVVVTLNHRLGVLGYLRLDHLLGEEYAAAGVAGMLDLLAALEWVRDNAEAFGGDPHNVMIFGCSGGGDKVSHLLAMPHARGLFHKAVIQSGPGIRSFTPDQGADLTRRLLSALSLGENEAERLLELPAQQLIDAQSSLIQPGAAMLGNLQVGPVLTPGELPRHPFDPDAAPSAAEVPLLIGTNQDEMALVLGLDPRIPQLDDTAAQAWVVDALGPAAEGLYPVYRQEHPAAAPGDRLIRLLSDFMRSRSIRLAERKLTGGSAPVFMYLFCYQSPVVDGRLKACHALEVPFVFDTCAAAPITGDDPARLGLAADMSERWINFARSGDPGWATYELQHRTTMRFDLSSGVVDDPAGAERRAWVNFHTPVNA